MWNSRMVIDESRELATKIRLAGVSDEVQIEMVLEAWMGAFLAEFQSQHDQLVDVNKKADLALAETQGRLFKAQDEWRDMGEEKRRLQDELIEAIERQYRLEKDVSALSASLIQMGLEREQQRTLAISRLEELTAMTAEVARLNHERKAQAVTIESQRRHCDQLNADLVAAARERDGYLEMLAIRKRVWTPTPCKSKLKTESSVD